MRVFLVRHGQTAWNIGGRAQGHTDIPLDPTGLEQIQHLERAFQGIRLDRILSSDLTRARQTAEPIAKATHAPFFARADLRERGFGEWEGSPFTEVHSRLIEMSLELGIPWVDVRPPGGESFAGLWKRTQPLVRTIIEEDDDVAIVSHGGTCSVILAQFIHGTVASSRSFRFANTAICELERRGDGYFNLVRYNDTDHLSLHLGTASPPL